MKLFDTHAHLTDEAFDGDRDAIVAAAHEGGVLGIVDVACHLDEIPATLALAAKYPFVYAAAGMHPHVAGDTRKEHLDALSAYFDKEKKLLALGEIGLDYHYDFAPRDVQKKWFAEQLDLAIEKNLPVVLHIREAFGDCMEILRARRGKLSGVMHCFSGSYEIAKECVELNLYIAFGGALTFKNAAKLADAAAKLPLSRIVLETDCPYMTPEPFRGRRNDPSLMRYTAKRLAAIRGIDADEAAEATYQNALQLFSIDS